MENRTRLDALELSPNGAVQVRFVKERLLDGKVVGAADHVPYHRTVIEPGIDVDAQMRAVNEHLVAMGEAPCEDYQALKDLVATAHTPEVVSKFKLDRADVLAAVAGVNRALAKG